MMANEATQRVLTTVMTTDNFALDNLLILARPGGFEPPTHSLEEPGFSN